VQFSRGCPFQCEFCDIIVMLGRRPRLKGVEQIVRELENLRAHRMSTVFIVDDNLIGHKKAMKDVLRRVAAWQEDNGFPLTFVTEASIDLADDDELMQLMVAANIGAVFVGIESPNEASVREAKKLQNLRSGGSALDKVRRIQGAGMEVWAGMILGFDNDDSGIFAAHRRFLRDARISTAMVGMLSAIPKTPLYARLAAAGRLDTADEPAYGTNVEPLQLTREALSRGYVELMTELYELGAYFDRLDDLYIGARIEIDRAWQRYGARHPARFGRRYVRLWLESLGLMLRLRLRVPDAPLRREYFRRLRHLLQIRRNPAILRIYALKCALHFHAQMLVRALRRADGSPINTY
jgi:radical SAM superfamily enzyme YgiQ (UPF0313 family)